MFFNPIKRNKSEVDVVVHLKTGTSFKAVLNKDQQVTWEGLTDKTVWHFLNRSHTKKRIVQGDSIDYIEAKV